MRKIIDISPPIAPSTAVWPGDTPFSRQVLLELEKGASVHLSGITTTLHIGAHADAPNHYQVAGQAIDEVDLHPYLGPCLVIHALGVDQIQPEHCREAALRRTRRVLFRTGTMPRWDVFPESFASFSPESIEYLAGLGVQLVGIDTPSVDPFDSKTLPAHHGLLKYGMRNLEGLCLDQVDEGWYDLIAPPLRIVGADASPVRALLRERKRPPGR